MDRKVEGSYITDLFKGIRKTESADVIGKLKKDDVDKKYCRGYTVVKIPYYAAWQILLKDCYNECNEVFERV